MNERRQPAHPGAILDALMRAEELYLARVDAALEPKGLTGVKFAALAVLAEAEQPLALGELAQRLACVKSNITQLVDRLEGDGLVRRLPDAADRRSKRAAITDEGRRRYQEGLKAKTKLDREMTAGLSAHEAEVLQAALVKLAAAQSE